MLLALFALPIRADAGRLRPIVLEVACIILTPGGSPASPASPASAPRRSTPTTRLSTTGGRLACRDLPRSVTITGEVPELPTVVALHPCPGHRRVTVDTPVRSFPLIRDVNPRRESMRIRLAATSFVRELILKSRCCLNNMRKSMVLVDSESSSLLIDGRSPRRKEVRNSRSL